MSTPRVYKNKTDLILATISSTDVVLDVGFLGQGITEDDEKWPHAVLRNAAREVYGVDLTIDRNAFPDMLHYQEASAESFLFP